MCLLRYDDSENEAGSKDHEEDKEGDEMDRDLARLEVDDSDDGYV